MSGMEPKPVLDVRGVHKRFRGSAGDVVALEDVSLQIPAGGILGVVGESGSGKTTLARCVVGLERPGAGTVTIGGHDVHRLRAAQRSALYKEVQMVFQDPLAALDPRRTVGEALREPLDWHRAGSPSERTQAVAAALERVDLSPDLEGRLPHELSGGQRQRVCLARALVLKPRLVVLDEPVTALDVSVQARILSLVERVRAEDGVAFLLISHDLAVVQQVADSVAVLHRGRLVEQAPADVLFRQPLHPYTEALLAAVPAPDPARRATPPPVAAPPGGRQGCLFRARCPHAMPRCESERPADTQQPIAGGIHRVQCHLHEA